MNITQLFNLKASLIASRVRLADAIEEVQQAIDEALAPDAGLVVKDDALPLTLCVEGSDNFERFIPRAMWLLHGQPMRDGDYLLSQAAWPSVSPNAYDISHLTIAAGRGEGEVEADVRPFMWNATQPCDAGLIVGPLGIAWWGQWPWAQDAVLYNHDGRYAYRWWHPDESTTLDCAAVPHAMTWRAA